MDRLCCRLLHCSRPACVQSQLRLPTAQGRRRSLLRAAPQRPPVYPRSIPPLRPIRASTSDPPPPTANLCCRALPRACMLLARTLAAAAFLEHVRRRQGTMQASGSAGQRAPQPCTRLNCGKRPRRVRLNGLILGQGQQCGASASSAACSAPGGGGTRQLQQQRPAQSPVHQHLSPRFAARTRATETERENTAEEGQAARSRSRRLPSPIPPPCHRLRSARGQRFGSETRRSRGGLGLIV